MRNRTGRNGTARWRSRLCLPSGLFAMHLASWAVGGGGQAQAGEPQLLAATIAGGGNASRGGAFTIDGTVGQSVAGTSRGGNYELAAGFWPMAVVVQETGAPVLR